MASLHADYRFYCTQDMDLDVKVLVGHLDVRNLARTLQAAGLDGAAGPDDLVVRVHTTLQGVEFSRLAQATQLPLRTTKRFAFWEEWVTLPLRFSDLPRDAELVVTLWAPAADGSERLVGGASIGMFDEQLQLRRGLQKLTLIPKQTGAGAGAAAPVSPAAGEADEGFRLLKAREQLAVGEIPRVPWLDRMASTQLEAWRHDLVQPLDPLERARRVEGPECHLFIELPLFELPVVFGEPAYGQSHDTPTLAPNHMGPAVLDTDPVGAFWEERLGVVFDPDTPLDNLVDVKYSKLARGLMRGAIDASVRPNREQLRKLQRALAKDPDEDLTPEEGHLMWQFQHTLLTNKKALVRFLSCVDWENEVEAEQAAELLPRWAPIDGDDALRLLAPRYQHPGVRRFAVDTLRRTADAELVRWLLQLVQALRYEPGLRARWGAEPVDQHAADDEAVAVDDAGGDGAPQPTQPAAEGEATPMAPPAAAASAGAGGGGGGSGGGSGADMPPPASTTSMLASRADDTPDSPLLEMLVERASTNESIANFLKWYLVVETEDEALGPMFQRVLETLYARLDLTPRGRAIRSALQTQAEFVDTVMDAVGQAISNKREAQTQKQRNLNALLSETGEFASLLHLRTPVMLPLDPRCKVNGIVAGSCRIFKSSVYPALVRLRVSAQSDPAFIEETFGAEGREWLARRRRQREAGMSASGGAAVGGADRSGGDGVGGGSGGGGGDGADGTATGRDTPRAVEGSGMMELNTDATPFVYDVIFKIGDDLRQDQLIIQLIQLMDVQLKRLNVDLALTPYPVLATSAMSGMMRCVEGATALDGIKSDILGFLQKIPENRDPSAPHGVRADIMSNYTKSCAGYCVITYVLGVGDRHFDNILLLQRSGHLFHVDFGYIFGEDPKPLPPPMKLTKNMLDGMGGVSGHYYERFLVNCCQAYNIIRKSANLFITLLSLMRDANINDLGPDPDKKIAAVREKFKLKFSDEDAERIFLQVLDDSVAALFPHISDFIHTFATRLLR